MVRNDRSREASPESNCRSRPPHSSATWRSWPVMVGEPAFTTASATVVSGGSRYTPGGAHLPRHHDARERLDVHRRLALVVAEKGDDARTHTVQGNARHHYAVEPRMMQRAVGRHLDLAAEGGRRRRQRGRHAIGSQEGECRHDTVRMRSGCRWTRRTEHGARIPRELTPACTCRHTVGSGGRVRSLQSSALG